MIAPKEHRMMKQNEVNNFSYITKRICFKRFECAGTVYTDNYILVVTLGVSFYS